MFFERGDEERKLFSSYLNSVISASYDEMGEKLVIMGLLLPASSEKQHNTLLRKMNDIIAAAVDGTESKGTVSDGEKARLKSDLPQIFGFILPMIKTGLESDMSLELLYSFLGNSDVIIGRHYAENVLVLCEEQDSYHRPVTLAGAVISVDETTADVTSVVLDGKKLNAGTDYAVHYADASGKITEPLVSGTYTAIVTGTGSYKGEERLEFYAELPHYHKWIIAGDMAVAAVKCLNEGCEYVTGREYTAKLSVPGKQYDAKPSEGSVELDEGFPREIAVGEIEYRSADGSDSLSEPGEYTASVLVYNKEDPSERAEISVSYTISGIIPEPGSLEFDIAENTSDVLSVMYKGELLSEGTDYTLYYTDKNGNIISKPGNAGDYYVVWQGTGHYAGSCEEMFSIKADMLTAIAVTGAVCAAAAFGVFIFIRKNKSR